MADPFRDEPAPRPPAPEIGGDLSTLSLDEIDARVAALEAEIVRLREARDAKEASRRAADSFFRS